MRIAVVSDIHANHLALQAFLRFLSRNPEISLVLNAGDLINIGPHPREVLDVVLDDPRFVHVAGNNEEAMQGLSDGEETQRHRRWTASRVGDALLERVCALPRSQVGEYGGYRVLLLHSRPATTTEWPLLFQRRSLREFFADYNAEEPDVVIFGHTHEPFLLREDGRLFLNPGALGVSRLPHSCFAVLDLDPQGIEVEFRRLVWDREQLAEDYVARNVPEREFILQHYFGKASFTN